MSFGEVLTLWQEDAAFRAFFSDLLSDVPLKAFRWETPPITASTLNRDFEFVTLDCPGLIRTPDRMAFSDHFNAGNSSGNVTVFANLGGDAVLVVPLPIGPDSAYAHLAAFVRGAPEAQRHALWQSLSEAAEKRVGSRPVWISTAGMGVAWLHVRLDDRPKYYGYRAYAQTI
ncbi:MAG TPA: hypothetical protein VHK01_05265 [Lacipirellulaceae bacterium]|nr:hypothetical protein [Lacipirellulaceae bacterium]